MNILQIIPHSYLSGASRHLMILAEGLQRRGHRVTIVCLPGGWLPTQACAAGIPVLEREMIGTRSWTTIRDLVRFARSQKVDLIHTHATRAAYHGLPVGLLARRPVAASVHTQTNDPVYRRFLPRGRNRVIAVSDFVRDSLLRQGAPAARVRTIYNGTELAPESDHKAEGQSVREELDLPPNAELVGVFGHLSELKGQPLLVQSIPGILAQRPHAHFVFAGHALQDSRDGLMAAADALGVADRLRLAGMRYDTPRLMAAMDVVAVPSQIEAFSMVVLEAMAAGKAIVGARVGGIPEAVVEDVTGLLVEREPDALAAAIVALLQDPERRAAMGQVGRERVHALFSADVMVGNVEALYREMLN